MPMPERRLDAAHRRAPVHQSAQDQEIDHDAREKSDQHAHDHRDAVLPDHLLERQRHDDRASDVLAPHQLDERAEQ